LSEPDLGFDRNRRLLELAREGGQTAVYQPKKYVPHRRHATFVALVPT
jgi:hypothetical protein